MRLFTILSCFCLPAALLAQISFTDASNRLSNSFRSGAAIAVVDLNGDGLDDIARAQNGDGVVIDLQSADADTFINRPTAAILTGSVWSICAGDVNNDGINDIGIGTYGQPTVLMSNASPFYQRTLLSEFVFAQGYNMVDMNRDGMLDIFVCHDVGLSTPYENDGTGAFTYNLDLMPAYGDGESDDSGNYGSLFTDYDNDGDLDMYMSRCRGGVADPLDPRRMNNLYRNNGDGTFTDVAVEAGLRPYNQTWATDFADLDNDGDLDVVMVNHSAVSRIYEQTSTGVFTERTDTNPIGQIANWNGIQVFCEDFDNDTDLDVLLTAGSAHYLLENLGNFEFAFNDALDFLTDQVQSAACGDLNNDGTLDLLCGFSNGLIGSGDMDDMLLMGVPNGNHYLRVRLNGSESNPNGIGARMEIYGDWGMQIREMRSGESYGIMNSLTDQFGLGSHTSIDSLIVKWPSGQITRIDNPDIDQTIVVAELPILYDDTEVSICEGESYLAPNGELYTEAGTFSLDSTQTAEGGLLITRLILEVGQTYSMGLQSTVCSGDMITLPDGSEVVAEESFEEVYNLLTESGCDSTVTLNLTVLVSPLVQDQASVCQGGEYLLPDGTLISDIQSPYVYQIDGLATNGCDSTYQLIITPDEPLAGTLELHACAGETISLPDGSILEDIQETTEVELLLQNESGCDSVLLTTVTVQDTDFSIINNDSLGFTADVEAETYQWVDCNTGLPVADATSASFTPPYNGDFSVLVSIAGCLESSDCVSYVFSSDSEPIWASEITLYPNPTAGQVWLELPNDAGEVNISVQTALGQFVLPQVDRISSERMSIQLPNQSGIYWLRIQDQDGRYTTRRLIVR
ncbi:MAG: FG-GAP-like repeat-containing protein [Bacteroidota bacterium]